jgi:hypothetical protein
VDVAAQFGLTPRSVTRLLQERWPEAEVFEARWRSARTFTDDEMLDALRMAALTAGAPSPMTGAFYDEWGSQDANRPQKLTIMLRYGGWTNAMEAAGLPANPAVRGAGQFTAEVCARALAECWNELGQCPTMRAYSAWQRQQEHQPGDQRVRSRWGERWSDAVLAAYRLVYGRLPPRFEGRTATTWAERHQPLTWPGPFEGQPYRRRFVAEWEDERQIFSRDPRS